MKCVCVCAAHITWRALWRWIYIVNVKIKILASWRWIFYLSLLFANGKNWKETFTKHISSSSWWSRQRMADAAVAIQTFNQFCGCIQCRDRKRVHNGILQRTKMKKYTRAHTHFVCITITLLCRITYDNKMMARKRTARQTKIAQHITAHTHTHRDRERGRRRRCINAIPHTVAKTV